MLVHRPITAGLRPTALAAIVAAAAIAGTMLDDARAQMAPAGGAVIADDNTTAIPDGFREWVFIGAPLTPNGLNGGAAGFPEFHHVYIEPQAYRTYLETGAFPEGTTIVKELVLLQDGHHPDGSRDEASGRGFFADRFAGIDMMVKDTARFADTNGWGFFNFGHHEPPYADRAEALPQDACAFCHEANATDDMVFTTFYPILGRK